MSETACINDNIQAKVREIFMLREFMVANQLTSAMSDAIREPAQQLYLTDPKFKNLIDGLTAGFMRLFVENTFPVPPDKVTVFCPGKDETKLRLAMMGAGFRLVHADNKGSGKVLGYEV